MESKFTGRLLGLIGINLLQFVIIVFTLTLGTPWAICMKERWLVEHTVIDGSQLAFDGTGWQLLGNFAKWFLFVIITVGIFMFWLPIKIKKWTTKHTHIVGRSGIKSLNVITY